MSYYRYIPDEGEPMFVNQMPTDLIVELLDSGVYLVDDGSTASKDDIMEQMRIELIVRSRA